MDDTDAEELRVEVVVVDYYMSKPLPLNAIEKLPPSPCYARAHAVPVVRIFGATPAGQKTLVHIHGIFPYFYFRAETHAAFDDPERLRSFLPQLAKEIEAAHDSNQPQRQKDKATWSCGKLIAKMLIVQGTPFYGYHATSKLFVQIFLYDPLAVKAVVHVLESGCLGGVRFQPYEAHVPFLLQVFADYNIEGMNYVAFSNVHFRAPLPVVQDHLVHDESGQYHVRLSSTVPAHRIHGVKIQTTSWTGRYVAVPRVSTQWYDRHSTCALEADVAGACILNPQRFESMQRKAAMDGEVRHVPALAAIWEEERGRRSRRGERATPTMSCSLSRQEVAPARASRNRSPTHDATSSSLLSQSFFQHTMEQAVAAVMKNVEAQATRAAASALTPAVWDVSCGKSIAAASAYSYSQAEHASTDTREGGEDGRGRGDGTSTESDCFRPPTAEEDEAIVNLLLAMQRDTSRAEAGTTARARGHDARAGYESVDEASDDGGDDAHTDTDAHDEIHNILASQRLVEDQRLRERRGLPGQEKVWGPLASPGRERDNCRAILPPRQAHAHTVETTPCASCCASSPRSDSIVQTRARAGSREDVPLVGDIEDLLPPRPQALVHVSRTRSDASEPMQGAPLSRTPHPPPPKESRATVAPVPSLAAASNTGDKTRWWRFRPDPPSYTQLLSSSHAVGVTRIQYQAAFYSKAADIPPKPLVFGGKKYRFTPQDRRHLPTFDTTATRARLNALETSRPSSSWGKLAQCQTASIGREGEEKQRRWWTPARLPPDATVVHAWAVKTPSSPPEVCRRKRARSSVVLTPTSPSTPRSAPTTRSNLTILSVEVFAPSRGTMLPHPLHDPVTAICYAIEAQEGPVPDQTHERGVLLVQRDDDVAPNAATLQSEGLWRDHDEDNVSVLVVADERALLHAFEDVVRRWDPDFLVGFEVQKASIGYLVDRAAQMDMNLIQSLSRLPSTPIDRRNATPTSEHVRDSQHDDASIGTTWGMHKAAGLWMHGRHVLNLWRLTRSELKLSRYALENVVAAVLERPYPVYSAPDLTCWFRKGGPLRWKVVRYVLERATLNLHLLAKLQLITRTSEMARLFGIDFYSVLSRGSQYRVEAVLLRVTKRHKFLLVSPSRDQVAAQAPMECIPLVMEPHSNFYPDPVVVLDFQSLYPSLVIAYNLCYSTLLGRLKDGLKPELEPSLGVVDFVPDATGLWHCRDDVVLAPNGTLFCPKRYRQGLLPLILDELLSTRIMVKHAMKRAREAKQDRLAHVLDARQLALKLISNVTYGYTAAGFSGRMPCAQLADAIVQTGRCTLEAAIRLIEEQQEWQAKVVYGDTDSVFVLLSGRSKADAFRIGQEMADAVTRSNPSPVTLKLEKVYMGSLLVSKKRYVGNKFDSSRQAKGVMEAKGLELARRDSCGVVHHAMRAAVETLFASRDLSKVKHGLETYWLAILDHRVPLKEFIFAKEVRLGTYHASGSVPPAALVSLKAMEKDPRAEPRYAERVPYLVVNGPPGARLMDLVVSPDEFVATRKHFGLNYHYYIEKQILPSLERLLLLTGANIRAWYATLPRPSVKAHHHVSKGTPPTRRRAGRSIDSFYLSQHCRLCGAVGKETLCQTCSANPQPSLLAIHTAWARHEKAMMALQVACTACADRTAFTSCGNVFCRVWNQIQLFEMDRATLLYQERQR